MTNEVNANCTDDKRPQCWVVRSLKTVGLYPQVFFASKARVNSIKFVFTKNGESIAPRGEVEYENPAKFEELGVMWGAEVYVEDMSSFSKTICEDYVSCRRLVDELNEDLLLRIIRYYECNNIKVPKNVEKEAQEYIKLARTLESCFDDSPVATIENYLGVTNIELGE